MVIGFIVYKMRMKRKEVTQVSDGSESGNFELDKATKDNKSTTYN